MIKRTITSEDPFTGEQVTNDFYFHLTKADIIRIIGRDRQGDWDKYVKSIIDSGDTDMILNFIESVIRDSVGKRTPEGLFVKPKDFSEAFIASDAYGELFVSLIQNEEESQRFFKGIIGERNGETADNRGLKTIAQKNGGKNHNHKKR
jgi:hypothetical protein